MRRFFFAALMMICVTVMAQRGITSTTQSSHALMSSVPLTSVQWTDGFWAERFDVLSKTSVRSM